MYVPTHSRPSRAARREESWSDGSPSPVPKIRVVSPVIRLRPPLATVAQTAPEASWVTARTLSPASPSRFPRLTRTPWRRRASPSVHVPIQTLPSWSW